MIVYRKLTIEDVRAAIDIGAWKNAGRIARQIVHALYPEGLHVRCGICNRLLDTEDILSINCGGDCLQCMADAGDPDAKRTIAVAKQRLHI